MDDLFLPKREALTFIFNLPNFPTVLSTVAMLLFNLKLVAGTQSSLFVTVEGVYPVNRNGKLCVHF